MNYKRKSTCGWSIFNVLMDFTGGTFSLLQIFVDASVSGNWDIIGGMNSVKFFLAILSIIFDIFFMFQHYILYNDNNIAEDNVKTPSTTAFLRIGSCLCAIEIQVQGSVFDC